MAAPDLHPALAPVAFLLGGWEGPGRGDYPTIDDFTYTEQLTFGHVGKPFLGYAQRTRGDDGAPLHAETGYLRVTGPQEGSKGHAVEMVVAQPTGIVEVLTGTVRHEAIELRSSTVATTPTAKPVQATARRLRLVDDGLVTETDMAAVGRPLQFHLASTLRRVNT